MKWLCLLLSLVLVTAMTVPPPEITKPKILAHYMPWFRAEKTTNGMAWEHWEWFGRGPKHDPETVLQNGRHDIASVFYPSIGPYDGREAAVLEYHMLTAKAAGIDGFVADWYGPGGYTDQVVHDQLAPQKIFFPPAGSPALLPGVTKTSFMRPSWRSWP